jgi:hypothetical protein
MRLALPAGPSRAVEPGVHVCGSPAALNVSHCGVDNVQAIRFFGMASQGRKESNPQPSALEAAALPLSYVPMTTN